MSSAVLYIRENCPLLTALLDSQMPGDTPVTEIPEWLNRRLGPLGLEPIRGEEEVTTSADRIERFLKEQGFELEEYTGYVT